MSRLALATGLAFGLLAPLGCKSEDSAQSAQAPAEIVGLPKKYELGQTAKNAHFSLQLKSTKRCSVEPHFQPPAGIEKLGVELLLEGLSHVEVPVNAFYATLRDADGERFEATLLGCTPQLEARRVTQGQSATGWITFDIPEGARELELMYRPALIGAGTEEVTFKLEP